MAPEKPYPKLTAEQLKGLDEAETIMTRAFAEARAKISAVGVPGDGTTRCLVGAPHCEAFLPGPGMKCKRSGCGHFFTRHDVF